MRGTKLGLFFAIQLRIMLLCKSANILREIQQSFPLFDIQSHGHSLKAVDAQCALLTDFAVQRSPVLLISFCQDSIRLFDTQLTSGKFFQYVFSIHKLPFPSEFVPELSGLTVQLAAWGCRGNLQEFRTS